MATTDREKEREAELEGAMYTNCLLLGLDPAVLGSSSGPRVGLFRHSNPRLGEQLLYFLLSSLRGPAQTSTRSGRFSTRPSPESSGRSSKALSASLSSKVPCRGATPGSHHLRHAVDRGQSTTTALNCISFCQSKVGAFIVLVWLRAYPVLKASTHCGAYLQQELEKLQDMRNKAKLEGELWDERLSSSSGQNSHLVSKATRLWESILARKGQHEVLASGPIEDLISHREHRYRISGSQLLAAMDLSSSVPHSELLSARAGEASPILDKQGHISPLFQGKEEAISRLDDKNGRTQQTVDVAEILRRWTHALQRIHKQSLHLAKANDGEGPELLRSASDGETSTHADSLTATLAEHRQHLVSIQGLINQLKEAIPSMQQSIAELSEEVTSSSSNPMDQLHSRLPLSVQNTGLARPEESSSDVSEVTSMLSSTHLEKPMSSPALKLPPLFSLTPSSTGKGTQTQKRNALIRQPSQEVTSEEKTLAAPPAKDQLNGSAHENDGYLAHDIRRSVREAALSKPLRNTEKPQDKDSDDGSEHFFIPLSTGASVKEMDAANNRRKQRSVVSSPQMKFPTSTSDHYYSTSSPLSTSPVLFNELNGHQSFFTDDALDQVFSPPLLLESSLFPDTDEDLLGKTFFFKKRT
ncbi:hypothetical protein PR202_gb06950 [Eleusine coracana subsp. coracana]|uniref:HAUS augmin-like complex subunit 6 N-terminal domain-containing protein n=1 Tax=Eleusine coracana subsp. coracana TaxID=191504 RepID=A0AAV5EA75_ELECO|nr:hypothetical protein PR202_gb06950 [Eleusine coracana subsp. coracana]